jgi:hypothetical protein
VLGDVLGGNGVRSVDQTDDGAVRQVLDDGTQIGTHGVVVGEVPDDNGKDGPAMETTQAWSRQ